jgi:hypothetical protein
VFSQFEGKKNSPVKEGKKTAWNGMRSLRYIIPSDHRHQCPRCQVAKDYIQFRQGQFSLLGHSTSKGPWCRDDEYLPLETRYFFLEAITSPEISQIPQGFPLLEKK